jgi:hypothetical protein
VNHTAETVATLDTGVAPRRRRRMWRARRREGQRSMWPVAVVMLHEDVEDSLQMPVVQDPPSRTSWSVRDSRPLWRCC